MLSRALQAVVWQQGALVAPQHLQQQVAYHDARLRARFDAALPHHFGIVQLTIDTLALAHNALHFPAGEVVLPSGDVLVWDDLQGIDGVQRGLPQDTPVQGEALAVYLMLPRLRPGQSNVHFDGLSTKPSTPPRFIAHQKAFHELTAAHGAPVEVTLAQANIRLVFGDELSSEDDHIQILSLQRQSTGAWALDPQYLAPSLRLSHYGPFIRRLQAVLARAEAAEHALRESLQEGAPATLRASLRLMGLRQLIPLLATLVQDAAMAPYTACHFLRQGLSHLLASEKAPLPQALLTAHFSQAHPGTSLWPLLTALEAAIDVAPAPLLTFGCAPSGQDTWQAAISPWPQDPEAIWFLQVHIQENGQPMRTCQPQYEQMMSHWLHLTKVSAPSELPRLVRAALRGLVLRPIDHFPDGRAKAAGAMLFALEGHPSIWAHMQREEGIAIGLPSAQPSITFHGEILCAPHGAR
jgi:type VI secretion system protein ImpJ